MAGDQGVVVFAEVRVSDRDDEPDVRSGGARRARAREIACRSSPRRRWFPRDRQPRPGSAGSWWHPDRAEAKTREHRLEELVAVLRLDQTRSPLLTPPSASAAVMASTRRSSSAQVQVASPTRSRSRCRGAAPPDAGNGEVHHPLRYGRDALRGRDARRRHLRRSRIET